jgi:hypothetical protein
MILDVNSDYFLVVDQRCVERDFFVLGDVAVLIMVASSTDVEIKLQIN